MTSQVSICNMALSHLGNSAMIDSIDEASKEAQACSLFYQNALDECLRDFVWPFATRIEALALEEEDPNTDWSRSYRYPANAVAFRRILNGVSRLETGGLFATTDRVYRSVGPVSAGSRIPFRIGSDANGQLIYTDQDNLYGEFTYRVTDPTKFPPDFVSAFSLLLAFYIAPRVTQGDQFKLGNRAIQAYFQRFEAAKVNAANESAEDQPLDSSFIMARE